MKKYISILFLTAILAVSCQEKAVPKQEVGEQDFTKFVNPFIGTGGHGHTYPGATTPFGQIQVSPVNGISGWDWVSGYHYSDSLLIGFGHLSLSGTGIGDLNDILLMPANKSYDLSTLLTGKKDQYPKEAASFRNQVPYKSRYSHENEQATAGYYQVFLEDPKINVELTADKYLGMHRYTFTQGDEQSVILNLGYAINWDNPTQMHIEKYSEALNGRNKGNIITGYRFSTGWAKNQKVFFAIEFSKEVKEIRLNKHISAEKGEKREGITSGQFFFDNTMPELIVKVGLSSVSVENALENISDYADNFAFDEVKEYAQELWQDNLGTIAVETPVDSLKTIFYTALYHTQVAPVTFSDKNGQFRQQNDSIYTAKDYTAYSTLSLWDTFRAENPLITLLQPKISEDIAKSMLAYYEVIQKLPVWTLYGNETDCMTGYHSIPVLAEAYFKGIPLDGEKLFQAMEKTMMGEERGLKFYKECGYIPYDKLDESVTISLEYAYDDWCVAQMAKSLGKKREYEFYLKRSEAYKHLFDAKTGFMRGKSSQGAWREPFDPKHSNHREATDYTEGNAWQHSWFVPHNPAGLIESFGGSAPFLVHLEKLFTESSEITGDNVSADISGLIGQYAHGNEPSHHIAYLFNIAGKPERTQFWVDKILQTQYNTTPNGLSGNEDCGQMSAWYVWSALGLYPLNPASIEYQIGRPLFERATINLKNGKKFVISAKNVSKENKYVHSVTLNGKELKNFILTDEQLKQGGELVFKMDKNPK